MQRIQRWRERRRAAHETPLGSGEADEFADFDPQAVGDEEGADTGGTARYRRRKSVDYGVVFADAAKRSRAKHRTTGKSADPVLAEMLLDFWDTFFECFREDEPEFELARFRDEAAEVQEQLDALPPGMPPDLVTCRQVLYLLLSFARDRFESWSKRFDDVAAQHRQLQAEVQAAQLTTSWLTDEMQHCREMIGNALKQRDQRVPNGPDGAEPRVTDMLGALLGVSAPAPKIEVHTSRIRRQTTAATESEPPEVRLQQTLDDLIAGRASVAKLNRVLEDRELALQLYEMAAEHRRFKGILSRIGLLTAY